MDNLPVVRSFRTFTFFHGTIRGKTPLYRFYHRIVTAGFRWSLGRRRLLLRSRHAGHKSVA
ncbi:hypothetical protein KHP57_22275, partial [Algiphilus sp. NNCM1]|nr:hypothetical protein [Algiphilus acroporae]